MTNPRPQTPTPAPQHPGVHRLLPRAATPAARRRSAARGALLWTPGMSRQPTPQEGQFYVSPGGQIRMSLDRVFRYGVATGRCHRDPTSDLRGALRAAPPAKRRAALLPRELPEFMQRLREYDGVSQTKLALELLIHTFVRTSEVRFARWFEFEGLEGEEPLWRIPASRMKMRRDHLVPLSPQVVRLVYEARELAGKSDLLFPAPTRSGVISENTMLYAMYRMGYHGRATVHGFRSTASTILNEREFNRDWVEMQLAHAEGDIRSVYNAAEWLAGRRTMMNWWSEHLEQISRCEVLATEPQ